MINDPEIEKMVAGWSFPVSMYSQMKWYENVIDDKNNYRFIIELVETKQAVGLISLTDIDWKNREAQYAIKLCSDAPKNQGIATDSEFALMRYYFEELQMHRLSSAVMISNVASIVMTEKCGAKREGVKRSALYKNGSYQDVILYGVLYEDFCEAAKNANWR